MRPMWARLGCRKVEDGRALLRVLGDIDQHRAGPGDLAIWKAWRMAGAMSSVLLMRKLCFVTGRVMPVMSTSWKASVPRILLETLPVMQTIGIESNMAVRCR